MEHTTRSDGSSVPSRIGSGIEAGRREVRRIAHRWALVPALLLVGLACLSPTTVNERGCRPDLNGKVGALVTVQVLRPGRDGNLTAVGPPGADIAARAGDTLRLIARPVEGTLHSAGADCPVRIAVGKLLPVGQITAHAGFVMDGGNAYALLGPGDERTVDVEIKPFADWDAAPDQIGVEDAEVHLPETGELVGRLPAPFRPPDGTVCVDVLDSAAQPAVGVTIGLAMPANGPRDARQVGLDGRICWDGLDPTSYGDVSLLGGSVPALGLPKARYVSAEANYRLFIVKPDASP